MYARWEDALDAQLDTYLWTQSERGQNYLGGWSESARSKTKGSLIDAAVGALGSVLFNAEPVWVEPEMMTLWEAAWPSFAPEPLLEADILTSTGFVYLPRPYLMTDVHGTKVTHRAFAWHPATLTTEEDDGSETTQPGVLLYLFHAVGDKDDYDAGDGFPTGKRGDRPPWSRGTLLLDHVFPWAYHRDYNDEFGPYDRTQSPIVATQVMQPVQCMLRLMQQTITLKEPGRPAKPWRRRWQKAKMPERNVVVVRLRRPKQEPHVDADKRQVEWTKRWIVSGFWRNQWYPSAGVHRQIYVHPYIKGPKDKPLEVRRMRVFDWSR